MDASSAHSRRVLIYSSLGHDMMHLMTAFYAVIVVTLAVAWNVPAEDLLEFYAPATILLGVMSLPAGWASDRFGAPIMMVVMFAGLGLFVDCLRPRPGRRPAGHVDRLCGIEAFGAIDHSVGIG